MVRNCKRCGGDGVEPDNKAIGRELRAQRESRCYSMREVAIAMGISSSYLGDLELGERRWTPGLRKVFLRVIGK